MTGWPGAPKVSAYHESRTPSHVPRVATASSAAYTTGGAPWGRAIRTGPAAAGSVTFAGSCTTASGARRTPSVQADGAAAGSVSSSTQLPPAKPVSAGTRAERFARGDSTPLHWATPPSKVAGPSSRAATSHAPVTSTSAGDAMPCDQTSVDGGAFGLIVTLTAASVRLKGGGSAVALSVNSHGAPDSVWYGMYAATV